MRRNPALFVICCFAIVAATFFFVRSAQSVESVAESKTRVFEIRTYTAEPGKLPDLLKRFRDHTTKLFEKHGMTSIGYWVPTDEPRSKNTLIYILAHENRDAAKKNWNGFRSDPDWIKVRDASEANGKIVTKVESIYAEPTDFSSIR
jgi:NIPSNAP protein